MKDDIAEGFEKKAGGDNRTMRSCVSSGKPLLMPLGYLNCVITYCKTVMKMGK